MSVLKFLYVYILKCSDGTYYTGVTNNPERRLEQHNSGIDKKSYTFSRRPLEMVYCERFVDYNLAIKWEKRIKDWSRKKKEALMKNNWDQLKIAGECRNETSHKNKINLRHVLDFARTDNARCDNARTDNARTDNARTDIPTNTFSEKK
jgi:putative endonuclease